MIEDVVTDEEEEEEVTFESLEYLELSSLSNLKSCSGKHTFIFPSLVRLVIRRCLKLQIFLPGVIIAPFLRTIEAENVRALSTDVYIVRKTIKDGINYLFGY